MRYHRCCLLVVLGLSFLHQGGHHEEALKRQRHFMSSCRQVHQAPVHTPRMEETDCTYVRLVVSLNNEGIESLRQGRLQEAARLFSQCLACSQRMLREVGVDDNRGQTNSSQVAGDQERYMCPPQDSEVSLSPPQQEYAVGAQEERDQERHVWRGHSAQNMSSMPLAVEPVWIPTGSLTMQSATKQQHHHNTCKKQSPPSRKETAADHSINDVSLSSKTPLVIDSFCKTTSNLQPTKQPKRGLAESSNHEHETGIHPLWSFPLSTSTSSTSRTHHKKTALEQSIEDYYTGEVRTAVFRAAYKLSFYRKDSDYHLKSRYHFSTLTLCSVTCMVNLALTRHMAALEEELDWAGGGADNTDVLLSSPEIRRRHFSTIIKLYELTYKLVYDNDGKNLYTPLPITALMVLGVAHNLLLLHEICGDDARASEYRSRFLSLFMYYFHELGCPLLAHRDLSNASHGDRGGARSPSQEGKTGKFLFDFLARTFAGIVLHDVPLPPAA